MWQRLLMIAVLLMSALGIWSLSTSAAKPDSSGLFARKNLVAWCIVPFDSKKRGPEERAVMLEKLGFTKFAYDYRAEHIPTFDAEIEALKRHHVELFAWWFPATLNDEAKMTLAVFAKHKVTPQLWITGGGGPTKDEADQRARVVAEATRIRPIAEAARAVGCKVALYNHGGWFGEPENQIAIIQELKLDNVGIVYNQHHGHDHLPRFAELLQKMKPYLYTLNLNGMVDDGERKQQKILQLSEGDLDLKLLKVIRDSGYTGPIGILGHTQDDAEQRLQDNLDGLDWLLPQLNGNAAGPKPRMRTPVPKAVSAVPAPTPATTKPLVEGKFGQALDGRAGGAFVAGRDEFRQFPLTVECWTKLADKAGYNILVASEMKSSGTHWELFSMAGNGNFTAYLPGFAPDHCNSTAMICDNQWHHVVMVLEVSRIRLYVDGKQVADQAHKRTDKASEPGGLALASLVDKAIGCSGLMDEVRISKGVRSITATPDKPFVVDDATVALWHLDELVEQKRLEDAVPKKGAAILGDANVAKPTGPTMSAKPAKIEGHWGEDAVGFRWTEADSRDDRFGKMDFGSFFSGSITGAGGPVYKGIVVRVGDQCEASVCYDTELLRVAAGWNGFLRFDPARFGIIVPPRIEGDVTFSTPRFPGVTTQPQFTNYREDHPYGPLPKDVAHYKGLYRHGKRVVLKYTVGLTNQAGDASDVTILESPWLESHNGVTAITRTFRVDPSPVPIQLMIADMDSRVRLQSNSASGLVIKQPGIGRVLAVAPHEKPVSLKLLIAAPNSNEEAFAELAASSPAPQDLSPLTQPGSAQWGEPLITKGEVSHADSSSPYVVDTITLPFENRFNALFFCGGHDFLPDGRGVVCTLHGDVWLVDGIDQSLKKVTWQRFATGLFQPLGLKVVNGDIYVVGRDQITRLRDTNNDGEADVFENFNNDAHVTLNGHEYVTCLETDRAGNFYYVKGNCNSQTPHDGSLLRVSADGSKLDVFATGFRNPNGIGMGPQDEITVAPQEGEWTPASGVFLVREGGFYGGMMSHHRPVPPTDFERPLVWFSRLADNSSGGQVWTTSDRWGPLSNQLLHMSYGQCRLRLILRDSGQLPELVLNNGASIELPMRFTSGIHRGRMNPHDGQLYVTGLKGWTTSAVHDGCFQRVRYTGKPLRMPIGIETYQNGVALKFSCDIERNAAQDPANFRLEAWNYKWSAAYGSPEYKPSAPGQVGRDEPEIRSATLLDKRTVFLELPGLKPVDQLAISYTLLSADQHELEQSVTFTLNAISKDPYPDASLYRQTQDPEQAKLLTSLVPGIDSIESPSEQNARENQPNARRMLTWDRSAQPDPRGTQHFYARGWIKIPMTGRYRFFGVDSGQPTTKSRPTSDSSRLEVSQLEVSYFGVGQHPKAEIPAEGLELALSRGLHPFNLEYSSRTGRNVHFRLLWESNRFPREAIPASVLFREPAAITLPFQQQAGAMLFEKLRCANCHETPALRESPRDQQTSDHAFLEIMRTAPRLNGIGSRLRPEWIADWLRQPDRLRRDATMPAVLHPGDLGAANDIAAYLATLQDTAPAHTAVSMPDTETDTLARTGAEIYERLGCIACHTTADPNQPDEWNRVSLHFVNTKYQQQGLIAYLRTPHRHYSGNRMPDFHLSDSEVAALAEYLRQVARGQLEALNGQAGDVERGRLAFAKYRCANCHSLDNTVTLAKPNVPPITTVFEQQGRDRGCMAAVASGPSKSPRFHLADADRDDLAQFLNARASSKTTTLQTRSLDRWLTELRCHACHSRDARQALLPEIIAEEGSGKAAESIPQLTWVGEKLQGPWMEKFLRGQIQHKPRPWLNARMPSFPAYAGLLAHGLAADHGVAFEEPLPTKLDANSIDMGRRLTLREGLDCRQCHGVGKEQPRGDASTQIALGINFAMTKDRLRPEFALRQMLDPGRYDVGSRMPRFAPDLKTTAAKQFADGDARQQFELLKQYLWSIAPD